MYRWGDITWLFVQKIACNCTVGSVNDCQYSTLYKGCVIR